MNALRNDLSDLAIALDADGVAIRSEPFTSELAKAKGIEPSRLKPFFANEFGACVIGQAELRDRLSPHLEDWGWKGGVNAFLEFWFQAENKPNVALLSEASRLRDRGAKLFLATNQERNRLEFMRNEMGFSSLFDHCFASCEMGVRKPDAGFYEGIAKDARLEGVEKVVFFDDREENVAPVGKLGWQGIVYRDIEDFLAWKRQYFSSGERSE